MYCFQDCYHFESLSSNVFCGSVSFAFVSVKCLILEEKSLLQDVVVLQHLVLKDFQPIDVKATSLEDPQGAQKDVIQFMQVFLHRIDLGECHTSYSAIGNFRQQIHKDDVVVFKTAGGSHVGQVRFHVQHFYMCRNMGHIGE